MPGSSGDGRGFAEVVTTAGVFDVVMESPEKGVQLAGKLVDEGVGASGSGQQYGSMRASQSSGRSSS